MPRLPFRLAGACLILLATEVLSFAIVPPSRALLGATGSAKFESCGFLSMSSSSSSTPSDGIRVDVDNDDDGVEPVKMSANPLYGYGRIEKALASPDDKRLSPEENEARRKKKVQQWLAALSSTNLNWGDRQAVADLPVWATPRVLDGGFVSGELLSQLQKDDKPNKYYLDGPGLMELDRLLQNGCYRISAPEQGALLMVAWKRQN